MTRLAPLAAGLAATMTLAAPAVAEQAADRADDRPSTVVRYDDLDLSTAAGRAAMDGRLLRASRRVCGSPTRRPHLDIVTCRQLALDGARSRLATQLAARADGGGQAGD